MPETPNIPPTGAELQRRALHHRYRIQVIPQPARADFGNGVVDTEDAWQWNVCIGRSGAAMATGHSCRTPHEAFDQALAAMRNLLPEPVPEPLVAPATYATGGYTNSSGYPVISYDGSSYGSAQRIQPYTVITDEVNRLESTGWDAIRPTVEAVQAQVRMYRDSTREAF